jgi:outer membrane protein assembly factor BamB
MHRAFYGLVLSALVITAVGCASQPTAEPRQSQTLPIEAPAASKVGYVGNWYQDLQLPDHQRVASAVRAGDLIMVREEPEPMISAVSVRDGRIRWRKQLAGADTVFQDPARSGDRVYLASETQVYVIQADNGERIKVNNLKHLAMTSPIVVDDRLVIGSANGMVFARDMQRPIRPWTFQMPGRFDVKPLHTGNHIVLADSQGNYAFINALDGTARWRGRTFGPIKAAPLADEEKVYIASTDRTLYALDQNSGGDVWTYRAEGELTQNPTLIGKTLYLPVAQHGMLALNTDTGQPRWQLSEALRAVSEREDQGELLLHGRRKLTLVRADSGIVVSEAGTKPLKTVLSGPDGSAVLITETGQVQRINPAN